jgi:hypothetical protein
MPRQTAPAPVIRTTSPAERSDTPRPRAQRGPRLTLLVIVPLAVIAVSVAFVLASGMRPGYDAYGWLVWGHQALHGHLDTNGAPSWKPLTFLFTLPFALAGRGAMWLWMVTAVAGGFSSVWFAARIAYRLTAPSPERRYAPFVAGAFAGAGVLGLSGYSQQTLIANSDLLVVALCLAAIDCHLSRRFRLAFILLVLAGLGRPEAWPFVGLYAVWAWRAVPSMRLLAVAGVAATALLSFGIPALTSNSWLRAGDLALNSVNAIHGNKILGVIGRFGGLSVFPVQLATLCGLALAVLRRDRATLVVAAAAALWVAIEIAFALHGWSAVPRYMYEAGAVAVVVAGTGVGRLLATAQSPWGILRWVGPLAVVILVALLVPIARHRERLLGRQVINTKLNARLLNGIPRAIARAGGATRVKSCGKPVTFLGWQSMLAFDIDLNVGNVGYRPGREIGSGRPIVVFRPNGLGWTVRPLHLRAADQTRCSALRVDTPPG